jgi:hypothetical protein
MEKFHLVATFAQAVRLIGDEISAIKSVFQGCDRIRRPVNGAAGCE